jgi:6-phosphogluconolactonase (cycloisomerase 2 family)
LVGCGAFLASCDHDELFGTGPGADAAVSTPAGIQSGEIPVAYSLASDSLNESDVRVTYSTGSSGFVEATEGTGGDGTKNLSVSEGGDQHTFMWNSGDDLDGERVEDVVIRVSPDSGTSDTSGSFTVNNGRFMAAVENREQGRVRLYSVDAVDGTVSFRSTVNTGGDDPYDVHYHDGHFLVVHQGSRDVAVLALDESTALLTPTEASPVRTDGIGSKYIASSSKFVFVANTGGETISIFDFDDETGDLTLNTHSGVQALGCQSILVRSNRLYVASQAAAEILIFDIADDGELLTNGASPVITGGLTSPRILARLGTRVYAGNFSEATISGFNLQGSGDLSPLAGSPFSISTSGAEAMAVLGTQLFVATGAGSNLVATTADGFGDLSEDATSPLALSGPSFTVDTAGSVVVAATSTSGRLFVWTVNSLGALNAASGSPVSLGIEVLRVSLSD